MWSKIIAAGSWLWTHRWVLWIVIAIAAVILLSLVGGLLWWGCSAPDPHLDIDGDGSAIYVPTKKKEWQAPSGTFHRDDFDEDIVRAKLYPIITGDEPAEVVAVGGVPPMVFISIGINPTNLDEAICVMRKAKKPAHKCRKIRGNKDRKKKSYLKSLLDVHACWSTRMRDACPGDVYRYVPMDMFTTLTSGQEMKIPAEEIGIIIVSPKYGHISRD
jgi:hypothetical protein